MNHYEKVLLKAYPHLIRIIEDMDRLVKKNALASHTSYLSGYELSERIVKIIDKKSRLLVLLEGIDEIINTFSLSERLLLEHKYFKRVEQIKVLMQLVNIQCSIRTYHRRQNKLLEKFSARLVKKGMCRCWFLDNYMDIGWLSTLYSRRSAAEGEAADCCVKDCRSENCKELCCSGYSYSCSS